jgi:phage tail-like protein
MPTDKRIDPYRGFNFRVEINGQVIGGFTDVNGLVADRDSIDYREGTDVPSNVRKLPGLSKFNNVTLKRGYTPNMELWRWYGNLAVGKSDRRAVTIVLMDEERRDVLRWELENAWVSKIEGPTLKASGNEVAIESVDLVHEGLTLELP